MWRFYLLDSVWQYDRVMQSIYYYLYLYVKYSLNIQQRQKSSPWIFQVNRKLNIITLTKWDLWSKIRLHIILSISCIKQRKVKRLSSFSICHKMINDLLQNLMYFSFYQIEKFKVWVSIYCCELRIIKNTLSLCNPYFCIMQKSNVTHQKITLLFSDIIS